MIDSPTSAHDLLGQQLGPYLAVELLGSGGMSSVYKAVNADGSREVALKVVAGGEDLRTHFQQIASEAMVSSAIRHPNVVTCLSYGAVGDNLYIVMELMAGGDTTRLVQRQGPLSETRILALAEQCALGLEAVHAAGFIHRDIKPSNVVLDDAGLAKIADLGLIFHTRDGIASDGVAGTPAYMSPEQATGQALDPRTDIYSLGATMYFWASGRPPFIADDVYETQMAVANAEPPSLFAVAPGISSRLATLIAHAMAKDRDRRYAGAGELLAAIRSVRAGGEAHTTIATAPVLAAKGGAKPRDRTARWLTAACILAAISGACGAMLAGAGGAPAAPPVLHAAHTPDLRAVPVAAARFITHRVGWTADPLLSLQESGEVRYARSGRRALFSSGASLAALDASSLTQTLIDAEQFSVELVLRPDNLAQQGPARIVASSLNHKLCNFMIGQSGSRLEVRCRTSATNTDGTRPHLVTPEDSLSGGFQHVVFVRGHGSHRLYIDGVEVAAVAVPGSLGEWDPALPLVIGDEHRGGFPWSGAIDAVTFIARPLSDADVARLHATWAAAVHAPQFALGDAQEPAP